MHRRLGAPVAHGSLVRDVTPVITDADHRTGKHGNWLLMLGRAARSYLATYSVKDQYLIFPNSGKYAVRLRLVCARHI